MSVMARRSLMARRYGPPPRYPARSRTMSARIRSAEVADRRAKYRAALPPRVTVNAIFPDWWSSIAFAVVAAVAIVVFVSVFSAHGLPRGAW